MTLETGGGAGLKPPARAPARTTWTRARIATWSFWGAAIALTAALAWCAWVTLDRFVESTTAVRSLRFTLVDVVWDQAASRLSVSVEVHNDAAITLDLEELSFSLYRGDKFVVTNPNSLADAALEAGKTTAFKYDLVLDPYFAAVVGDSGNRRAAGRWRLRGRALVLMPGVRPKFPVTVTADK